MSTARPLEHELNALKTELKKFLVFENPNNAEWGEFKKKFLQLHLSIDERFTCLMDLVSEDTVYIGYCYDLFEYVLNNTSEKDFFHLISVWLEKFIANKIIYQQNYSQLTDTFIKKLKSLKLSSKKLLEIISYTNENISIPSLLIEHLPRKCIWDLLWLLNQAISNDKSIAPDIYKLLTHYSKREMSLDAWHEAMMTDLTLSHLAVKHRKTIKLFFSLIDLLKNADINEDSIIALLKQKNSHSQLVVDNAINTTVDNIYDEKTPLASYIIKWFEKLLAKEDILSFLVNYGKGLYWLPASLQELVLELMLKKVQESPKFIEQVVTLLSVKDSFYSRSLPYYHLLHEKNFFVNALFKIVNLLLEMEVKNCLAFLKDFCEKTALTKLLHSNVPTPIVTNIIKFLIKNGLDFGDFIRKSDWMNPNNFDDYRNLLALYDAGIEQQAIKEILRKRLHVTFVSTLRNEMVYTIVSKLNFPSCEYDNDIRKCVFDHIRSLPENERKIEFTKIKDNIAPLANVFWVKPFLCCGKPMLVEKWQQKIEAALEEKQEVARMKCF